MLNYLSKRLIYAVVTIFVVITFIFILLSVLPGDAAILAGDPRIAQDPQALQALKESLGIDKPFYIQYIVYIKGLLTGNLGVSYRSSIPVSELIASSMPTTLKLVFLSFIIAMGTGIPLGFFAALKHNSWFDIFSMIFATMGISAPRFWVGLVLMYVFGVKFNVLPTGGYGDSLIYLILPSITLSIPLIALIARTTRAAVLNVMKEDYVTTARSKGLLESLIYLRHVLRNATIPIITIAGLQLGSLIANTLIVENVFSLPGIGRLILASIFRRDIPAIQGCIIIFSGSFILINLLVDVLYAYLDPRISV